MVVILLLARGMPGEHFCPSRSHVGRQATGYIGEQQQFNSGYDHINRNAPVLVRSRKLTRFEPA